MAEEVAAAITQLLTSRNPEEQRAADTWLNSYCSQSAAWETSLKLLTHPQAEVSYFAANLLLTKVRREWSELAEAQQGVVSGTVSSALASASALSPTSLLSRRLVLVLAACASRAAPAAAAQLASQALSAGEGELSLALLSSLAEEADEAPRARRAALLTALTPARDAVLTLAERTCGASEPPLAAALRTVHAWLKLDESSPAAGGGALSMSAAALRSAAPRLHACALRALASEDESCAESAADFLSQLHGASNARQTDGEAEARAGAETAEELLTLKGAVEAEDGEQAARGVARLATALAERHSEALAGGAGPWLGLCGLVCGSLAGRPEPGALEACSDFFLTLNVVPLQQRHPQLREPLFAGLAERCLAAARLPQEWSCWPAGEAEEAACGVDVDELQRFREQTLGDLLDCCFGVLRAGWLSAAVAAPLGLGGVPPEGDWRNCEAALFALRCAALPLRELALGDRGAPGEGERAQANALLTHLFTRLADREQAGPMLRGGHACCVQAACRLVGSLAAWLGRSPPGRPLAAGVAAFLLSSLRVRGCAPHAAEALRNLCARCAESLSEPQTLGWLIGTAHAGLPDCPPPPAAGAGPAPDDRTPVMEGLARLVSRLPAAQAREAGLALCSPLLRRAEASLEQAGARGEAALAAELHLLAAALRFMEGAGEAAGKGEEPPVLSVLRAAWPLLSRVGSSPPLAASPSVTSALCDVYGRAFTACRAAASPLLPPALAALLPAWERHLHAPCCDALASALEALAQPPTAPPSEEERALGEALARCTTAAAAALSQLPKPPPPGAPPTVQPPAVAPDALRALFELAQRAVIFSPRVLLSGGSLVPLLECAVAGVGSAERDPCVAAAKLLHMLLASGRQMAAWGDTWRAARPALEAALGGPQQLARRLLAALLQAAASTAPRSALSSLGAVLHALLALAGASGAEWLAEGLRGLHCAPLGEAERTAVLQVAARVPPLSLQRFEAFFTDLATICRREESGDALLSYQM